MAYMPCEHSTTNHNLARTLLQKCTNTNHVTMRPAIGEVAETDCYARIHANTVDYYIMILILPLRF